MTTARPVSRTGRDAEKYLLPGEEAIINQRRHWAVLARPAVRGVPFLALGLWLLVLAPDNRVTSLLGLLVGLGALAYLGLAVGEWWVRHFLVTKRRVLMTSGVVVRTVAVMPLRRITDLTYSESLVGQLLGYGGFRFESAGQDQALSSVSYLPDAKTLYDQISGLLFPSDAAGARRGSEEEDGGGPFPGAAPGPGPADGRHGTGPIPGFRSRYPRTH
ncbi:PH domain-containing protein [Modestobacter sp. Leaf380]|uniref:PH domain-containing protein n=1 Tax=Modestobacter sp. Leaf380 TaxID=1736356 RepID=UPI0006F579DD|nr:PH domain-containing protein [Modestobacter sp. Leaf380]KQS73377.1 hypothetical protein ASG41_01545 [Modestobacter sp. Leaf380]